MKAGCRIIVFAKAPAPGLAKTRLIPALGANGAARLAARFLAETVGQAGSAAIGDVELCCTPDTTHPAFAALARSGSVALTLQGEGDLGQRMASALARSLAAGQRCLLIGTDAPALGAACLRAAAAALDTADAVFAPTADGGYALVGLRCLAPQLFEAMPWSTDQVMAVTRRRLAASALRHVELAELSDVDVPADLAHVPAHWL